MKRNWFIIGALVLFVIGWNYFILVPHNQKQREALKAARENAKAQTVQETINGDLGGSAKTTHQITTSNTGSSLEGKSFKAESSRKQEVVHTWSFSQDRQLQLLSKGGVGKAILSDYHVRETKDKKPVELLSKGFVWSSTNPLIHACLNQMRIDQKSAGDLSPLTFSFNGSEGSCSFTLNPATKNYAFASAALTLKGFKGATGEVNFSGEDRYNLGQTQDHNYLMTMVDGSVSSVKEKDLLASKTVSGKINWLAWGDRYFATILLPQGNWNPNIFHKAAQSQSQENSDVEFGFSYPLAADRGEVATYSFDFYLGTRDSDILISIRDDLKKAVDLGFFGSVARLMIWALSAIHTVFANWGLSIIVLTILVRILFWPLNKKVFVSGQKMKALQPQIEKLKAKYGNDKSKSQEMNVELWGLYRKNKVDPFGSCLPMLLQMPIFFALYGALNHSLDLYQAPFFGWITDLSSKDPYFVLPVLWTLSLLAYIKINPVQSQPGAPDMKWIMMAMNLFIGFLSKDWPAGLTLYLFVSNLVGISQQMFMQRGYKKLQPVQEGV